MTDFDWPELYFIRHGETDWNAEGPLPGLAATFRSTTRGRAQADLNGQLLKRLLQRAGRNSEEFDWYVSPLSRTRETMERVRAAFTDTRCPDSRSDDRG